MLKRIAAVLTVCVLVSALFSGCGNVGGSDKLKVVTTIFPEYDFVNNILGEKKQDTDVTLLLDNGVDLHSYQPSAKDIVKISSCDLFIYVGGESDEWVDDALKEATNKNMTVINLIDVLGNSVFEEEVIDGMQTAESGDEKEYDEHVWLSLKNAVKICKAINTGLDKADEQNSAIYDKNTAEYIKSLEALDKKYAETVENSELKTLLFADRFPFRYMTEDYGLTYFAAFVGCSAESEASFETVAFLAKRVDEYNLPAVITLEGNDQKIAKTVIGNTATKSAKILTLNSMQSQIKSGDNYLSIMESNLKTLKEALKGE